MSGGLRDNHNEPLFRVELLVIEIKVWSLRGLRGNLLEKSIRATREKTVSIRKNEPFRTPILNTYSQESALYVNSINHLKILTMVKLSIYYNTKNYINIYKNIYISQNIGLTMVKVFKRFIEITLYMFSGRFLCIRDTKKPSKTLFLLENLTIFWGQRHTSNRFFSIRNSNRKVPVETLETKVRVISNRKPIYYLEQQCFLINFYFRRALERKGLKDFKDF